MKGVTFFQRGAGAGLALIFLAAWVLLLALIGRALIGLLPAMRAGDPASIGLGFILFPWLLYLAQGLFYLPQLSREQTFFIREKIFSFPIIFLFFPSSPHLETGLTWSYLTSTEERGQLSSQANFRLKSFNILARLSFLLESRSPLDLIFTALSRRSIIVAAPARIIYMVMGPARQFMRLWGYIFYSLWRVWHDLGPEDMRLSHKKALAYDLQLRLSSSGFETQSEMASKILPLLGALRRVYNNPGYGGAVETVDDHVLFYTETCHDPKYYGLYLNGPVTLAARTVDEIYDGGPEEDQAIFYPPALGEEVEKADLLAATRHRLLQVLGQHPSDSLIWLDGRLTSTWQVRRQVTDILADEKKIRARLAAHNRRCRSSHLAQATKIGRGWPEALRWLAGLIHLAEHGGQTLTQVMESLRRGEESLNLEADEEPSNLALLAMIQAQLKHLASRPEAAAWAPIIGDHDDALTLLAQMESLKKYALNSLLEAENDLDSQVAVNSAPPLVVQQPPEAVIVSFSEPSREHYQPDSQRLKAGFGPSAAALFLLGIVLWQGEVVGLSQIVVYNGLGCEVEVLANGDKLRVKPFGHSTFKLRPGQTYQIVTTSDGQVIESFWQRLAPEPATEVYNVAGASPLMEWETPRAEGEAGRFLGRPRWLLTKADILFSTPKQSEAKKLVLSGYADAAPEDILAPFESPKVRAELIKLHTRWDSPDLRWYKSWQKAQDSLAEAPQKP